MGNIIDKDSIELIGLPACGKTLYSNSYTGKRRCNILFKLHRIFLSPVLIGYAVSGGVVSLLFLMNGLCRYNHLNELYRNWFLSLLEKTVQIFKAYCKIGFYINTQSHSVVYDQGPVYEHAFILAALREFKFPSLLVSEDKFVRDLGKYVDGIVYLRLPVARSLDRMRKRESWKKYINYYSSECFIVKHVEIYSDIYDMLYYGAQLNKKVIDSDDSFVQSLVV